ncbi:hypothetical protein V5O48_013252 [Marasmius crinis-equi]|uniref:Uncharacterized protein n=1 Tax=Marasmius crinis-equi TaxID=585013 RepID=A0ABR3F111_9AGAR
MLCHVKFELDGKMRVGEVHFYFQDMVQHQTEHCAMVSLFGDPHPILLSESNQTYTTMQHFQDIDVRVIEAKKIHSVVMMAPDPCYRHIIQDGTKNNRWFMAEKPGLKILALQGYNEAGDGELVQQESGTQSSKA